MAPHARPGAGDLALEGWRSTARTRARGWAAQLLRDAIIRAVAAAEIIGVRALLVHALHEQARTFYAHFDFEPSPTDPLHLLLLIKDARGLLDPHR